MSPFVILPLFFIGCITVICLDVWAALKVADMTLGSGFSFGFYMITVFGLIACQVSAFVYFMS